MRTIIKSIKPMFNGLVTTLNKYPEDLRTEGSNLIDTTKAGSVKEYQTVIAVGPMVKGIKVGDTVFINPKRYMQTKHEEGSLKGGIIEDNMTIKYKFEIVNIKGVPHLYLLDNDITYIAEVEEVDSGIIIPDTNLKV